MDKSIKDKVVVITGGSAGVGKAMAGKFASEGAKTIILARTMSKLEKVKEEFEKDGLNLEIYSCDVADEDQVKQTVGDILKNHGFIDVLINNAGTGFKGLVEDVPLSVYEKTFETNVKGVFLMTRAVMPHMKAKKDGFILNISSGAGLNGHPGMSIYCASKFAVRGFTQAVAAEGKPYDIRVTVFFPGTINTGFHKHLGGEQPEEKKQSMMQPEDIADTAYHIVIQPKRYWVYEVTQRALFIGG